MATKLFTTNSFITSHSNFEGGDNCFLCSSYKSLKYAFHFDYENSCVLDWRVDRDFEDHGEFLVCSFCADRFDPDLLFEV